MARSKMPSGTILRRAVKIEQNLNHPLFLFALTGEELSQIAEISRISRDVDGELLGYQRPGVKKHINDIVDYLNQEDILFPNSIILALSSKVKFRQARGAGIKGDPLSQQVAAGTLEIPVPTSGKKPAWIVDGQQRALALSKCARQDMPIPVNGFIADEVELQRDQFLRVNNSKPLPRGLITELLPEVSSLLPSNLSTKRMPSAICTWLNQDESSPFKGLINRASTAKEDKSTAVISDTSIVKMIEESLTNAPGCLFPYRNIATGETDFEDICKILVSYWTAVAETFPDAWGKPPRRSRLMHGAGIRAVGRLMDRIIPSVDIDTPRVVPVIKKELKRVEPICRWTKGKWDDLDGLRWNEVQNVPRHINLLSNVLIRAYIQSKSNK